MQQQISAHPDISNFTLQIPNGTVYTIDPRKVDPPLIVEAQQLLLAGRVWSEEAFAGDATRIKKAPETPGSNPKARYLMHESKFFYTPHQLIVQTDEAGLIHNITNPQMLNADKYMPYCLGSMHLFKAAYEVFSLALKLGHTKAGAKDLLKQQVRLVVLPEQYWEDIVHEIAQNKYYGFNPENIFFMVQAKLPGYVIDEKTGEVRIDKNSKKLNWNHGAMKLQQAIPGEIFRAQVESNGLISIEIVSEREIKEIIARMEDSVSYSIEDMDLIKTGVVADLPMIAFAIAQKKKGDTQFLMEVVKQNMDKPQKGGFLAFNTTIAKMLETNGSGSLINLSLPEGAPLDNELKKIKFLNRNFNHTMDLTGQIAMMRTALRAIEETPLANVEEMILGFAHPEVKSGTSQIYPQPPQGDMNFNLRTVYAAKDPLPQISGLKVQDNLPAALPALYNGAKQSGFKDFIDDVLAGNI